MQMVEAIIHETAHLLLFGTGVGEPLNPDEERYASPLRSDPRPMEGVVHATYVLARIAAAMEQIGRFEGLTDVERARAGSVLKAYSAWFRESLGVIREHARFTKVGEAVFASCVSSFLAERTC
jgi:HEXXH motif-containing protein